MANRFALAERGQPPVDLPSPKAYDASPIRIGSTQTTMSGRRIQQTIGWRSTWVLDFGTITDEQYAGVAAWIDPAQHSLGPFDLYEGGVLIGQVNIDAVTRRPLLPGAVQAGMALSEA